MIGGGSVALLRDPIATELLTLPRDLLTIGFGRRRLAFPELLGLGCFGGNPSKDMHALIALVQIVLQAGTVRKSHRLGAEQKHLLFDRARGRLLSLAALRRRLHGLVAVDAETVIA